LFQRGPHTAKGPENQHGTSVEIEIMRRITAASDYPPKTSILINGEIVIFKLLEKPEGTALRDFFLQLSEGEVDDLRDDVHNPGTISAWIESLDYSKELPLIAWEESWKSIVAVSSLHFTEGVYRHIADVRIVVGKTHRKLGVGSALIKELIQLGTQLGVHLLRAEVLTENLLAAKAFRQMGFEYKGTFEDCFFTRKGQTRDIGIMLKFLRENMEDAMFYEF
jgi:L-amino acid N-acyltransferase YncA